MSIKRSELTKTVSKITPKMSLSQMIISNVLGLKKRFPYHKVAPRPQKLLELAKEHAKHNQKALPSALVGVPTAVT